MASLMELPGIKFLPTASELLGYLKGIIHGSIRLQPTAHASGIRLDNVGLMIHEYNVYSAEPWNLPRIHRSAYSVGSEAYYFSLRQKKHVNGNSMRADRIAGTGTWKASRSQKVMNEDGSAVLGHATKLFYAKDGQEQSSGWVMDEYRLPPDPRFPGQYEEWAICRVKLNATTEKRDQKRKANAWLMPMN